jgi:predicted RNA-binding protein with PIN domain
MPLLVDGDNLLGTSGRPRTGVERRKLAMELGRLGTRERRRVVTVFDGDNRNMPSPGSNVHFSGAGRTADDVILEIIRNDPDPKGWQVVTSDRPLGDRCRWLGATVIRCDRFRGRLVVDSTREKPEHEEDVDYWLGQFGGEEP